MAKYVVLHRARVSLDTLSSPSSVVVQNGFFSSSLWLAQQLRLCHLKGAPTGHVRDKVACAEIVSCRSHKLPK